MKKSAWFASLLAPLLLAAACSVSMNNSDLAAADPVVNRPAAGATTTRVPTTSTPITAPPIHRATSPAADPVVSQCAVSPKLLVTFDAGNSSITESKAINNAGDVAGLHTAVEGNRGFVRLANGTTRLLEGSTSPFASSAVAINDKGDVLLSATELDSTKTDWLESAGELIPITVPGATSTQSRALNNDGDVAGTIFRNTEFGFIRSRAGDVTTFAVNGSLGTRVWAMNEAGDVAGNYFLPESGYNQLGGFIRSAIGAIETFDIPDAQFIGVQAINDAGAVTGSWRDADGNTFGYVRHAGGTVNTFRVPGSAHTAATDMNESGLVTGVYNVGDGRRGFVRTPAGEFRTFNIADAFETAPAAVNDAGEVTGFYVEPTGAYRGFVLPAGQCLR